MEINKEYHRNWRKKNPEKKKAINQKYREKLKQKRKEIRQEKENNKYF